MQSVEIFAFSLEMLAKSFVYKSCRERTCLVRLVSTAGSLSETLRLSSKSWSPELLCMLRGQFLSFFQYLFAIQLHQDSSNPSPKTKEEGKVNSFAIIYLPLLSSVIH